MKDKIQSNALIFITQHPKYFQIQKGIENSNGNPPNLRGRDPQALQMGRQRFEYPFDVYLA